MAAAFVILGMIAALFSLTSQCRAAELTGFKSVYLGQKVVYISADQLDKAKCGIDDKPILNSIRADLKRSKVRIAEKWDDNSLILSLSITSVHLPIARVCALSIRLSASAVANVVQNIQGDRVVEIYGAGGFLTYSEKDGIAKVVDNVSEFTKDFANQLIGDN